MTADPLLAALFDRLPEPGTPFDPFDRARWLTALAACLDIVYGPQPRPAADPPADDDPDGPRRRPAGQRTPCGRCGLMLSPQGRSAHEAMHRRDDETAARRSAVHAAAEAELAAPAPPPPLAVAEPITRQPFDHDAARRRAADATSNTL